MKKEFDVQITIEVFFGTLEWKEICMKLGVDFPDEFRALHHFTLHNIIAFVDVDTSDLGGLLADNLNSIIMEKSGSS